MKIKTAVILSVLATGIFAAEQGTVAISSAYPGGNVKVNQVSPGRAEVEADLRDTPQAWFYWNFEAKAEKPGTVRFLFPVKQKQISAQGPAVSTDGGKTWKWLGMEKTEFQGKTPEGARDGFSWEFKNAGDKVRFAQSIPYQKADWERLLEKYKGNPNLKSGVLAKSRKGADVPMVIAGSEGPGKKKILLTARHHSCEAMGSHVFEGFLEEALSDSATGQDFRKKYVLYAIPFVDYDGVENGDQGKGRKPHDHNRDYGLATHLYPEIKAIEALDKEKKFFLALDLHNPSVRDDVHESFYFDGWRTPETHANTEEFSKWILEETAFRTLNFTNPKLMKVENGRGIPFSHYFGANPTTVYGITLEIPYANNDIKYDDKAAKEYGKGVLCAILRTEFSKEKTARKDYDDFQKMSRSFNGHPDDFIKKAETVLKDPNASALYKTEAKLRLGWIYPRIRKFDAALECNDTVMKSPDATARQRETAAVQKAELYNSDPKTTDEAIAKWADELETMRMSSLSRFNAYEALYQIFTRRKNSGKAFSYAEKQLPYAPDYFIGRTRNRIAAGYLANGEKDKAAEYSRTTVEFLKKQLFPKMPVGVFGHQQAEELVNALLMVPGTPKQEIMDAANLALNHKICFPDAKKRLTAVLETLNK